MPAEAASRPLSIASKIMFITRALMTCSVLPRPMPSQSRAAMCLMMQTNKRTGLTCALTYMERQGISIPRLADLEDLMVDVADGSVTSEELAEYFSAVWELSLSR
nr:hypothetical protein [Burkholderia pyrrocinia]